MPYKQYILFSAPYSIYNYRVSNVKMFCLNITENIDGLVQERRNSIANALELCLSCTNLSIYNMRVIELEPSVAHLLGPQLPSAALIGPLGQQNHQQIVHLRLCYKSEGLLKSHTGSSEVKLGTRLSKACYYSTSYK